MSDYLDDDRLSEYELIDKMYKPTWLDATDESSESKSSYVPYDWKSNPLPNPTPLPKANPLPNPNKPVYVKPVYVIAGNADQYHDYVKKNYHTGKTYRYVRNKDSIRGVENPDGVFIGSWRERDDINSLMVALLTIMKDENKREAIKQLMNKEFIA